MLKRVCFVVWMLVLYSFSVEAGPEPQDGELTSVLFPRTDPKVVGRIYQMLKVIDLLFTKYEIPYWIDGGTVLGAVRHGGFIPWDDDADLVFFMQDEERISALTEEFARYGLCLKKERVFRLYSSPHKRHPFVDLSGYSLFRNRTLRYARKAARKAFPNFYWLPEEVANLQRVKFGPIELNAPSDMMRYLYTGYGKDCLSMAVFQKPHRPGKQHGGVYQKVRIDDFSPAEYEIEDSSISLESPER